MANEGIGEMDDTIRYLGFAHDFPSHDEEGNGQENKRVHTVKDPLGHHLQPGRVIHEDVNHAWKTDGKGDRHSESQKQNQCDPYD